MSETSHLQVNCLVMMTIDNLLHYTQIISYIMAANHSSTIRQVAKEYGLTDTIAIE